MFNDLINLHDFVVAYERITQKGISAILSKILRRDEERVKYAWMEINKEPSHWWDIPEVRKRWNFLLTGDESIELQGYVRDKYLDKVNSLTGISIGCGAGNKEIEWVKSIKNLSLRGIDISAERIRYAIQNAKNNSVQDRLVFNCEDIYATHLGREVYDLIILDSSLHHFSPIQYVLEKVRTALKPNGIVVVNEYVGPSRFQWTDEQLSLVNDLLSKIPIPYRKLFRTKKIKNKVYRPGKLSMYISDPSEATESDKIEKEIGSYFHIVEMKEYGGTILQLLFKDIAQNFINDKTETKDLLKFIFSTEDYYLKIGKINSDFKFFVLK